MEETSYFLSFRREIFILYGLKKGSSDISRDSC